MAPNANARAQNEKEEKQYRRSTDFFNAHRDLRGTVGPNSAPNTLITLKTAKSFNFNKLYSDLNFDQYRSEIVRLYRSFNSQQAPLKHTKAIEIITQSVHFYHTNVSKAIGLDVIESIVFCHPYFDSISAQIIYQYKNNKTKPISAELGITRTVDVQQSAVTGSPFVIGLDWALINKSEHDHHELRDTVLHELAHAHMFIEGMCEEQYKKYYRHTERFAHQIANISEAFYKINNARFGFTNCGPHHLKVQAMEDLDIEFDPNEPNRCREHIKAYFTRWNKAFINEPKERKALKSAEKARKAADSKRKALKRVSERTSGRQSERSSKRVRKGF